MKTKKKATKATPKTTSKKVIAPKEVKTKPVTETIATVLKKAKRSSRLSRLSK